MIRKYRTEDSEALIGLCQEFGLYMQSLDKPHLDLMIVKDDYGKELLERTLANAEANQGVIYVAEIEDKVVGFIAGIIKTLGEEPDDDCKVHKMGRVSELFVTQSARGQGIGKELMQVLLDYFTNQSCYKVNIEVFAPNQDAYDFYKKLGFQARNYDLVKVIGNL